MHLIKNLSSILLALFVLASCGGGKKEVKAVPAETATIVMSIDGMTCTGCENTIQTNLMKAEGVVSVTATYADGKAVIKFDPMKIDTVKMKAVVDGIGGYTAMRTDAVADTTTVN